MIALGPQEEVDFMFRCSPRIDRRGAGVGWLYVTDRRIAFESDRLGLCFGIRPSCMDGQRTRGRNRFMFTWVEPDADALWRYLFDARIEKWDRWRPEASYVVQVLQDAVFGSAGPMGAGWRSRDGRVYNRIAEDGRRISALGGKTPEDQRTYRRWRTVWGRVSDMDFDFFGGRRGERDWLERLHDSKIRDAQTRTGKLAQECRGRAKAVKRAPDPKNTGVTPESLRESYEKYVVQRRILQIIKSERGLYTFGRQMDMRTAELRAVLTMLHRRGEDISRITPQSNVQSAMVRARRDIEKFQERLAVKLPTA